MVEFFNDPLSSKDVLTTYKPIRNECSFFDRPEDGGERAKQVLNIDTLDEGQSCNSVLDRLHVLIITTIQYCDQLAWQQLTRFAATQRVVEPIVGTFQNPVGSAASNLILGAAPNALSDESYVQLWQSSIKSANRAGRTNGVGVGGVGTGRIGIKAFAEPEDFDLKRFNFDYYNGLEPFQNSMMAGLIAEVSADRTLSLKGTLIPIVPASQKLPRDRSRRSHLVVWDREISSFGEVVAAAVGDTKMISIQKFTDGLTTGLAKGSYIVLGNGFELQNYFARHSLQPDDFPEYVTGFARRVLGAPVSGSVRN